VEPRRSFRWTSLGALTFSLSSCQAEGGDASTPPILRIDAGCVGVVLDGGTEFLYAAHCGERPGNAHDVYGFAYPLRNCSIHARASLGAGTDAALCDIVDWNGGSMPVARTIAPTERFFLAQRVPNGLVYHPAKLQGREGPEIRFETPGGSFCAGDSGSPILTVDHGRSTMVAFASSVEARQDCRKPGLLRAVPVYPALRTFSDE
jgi:hypothetical protein